MDVVIGIEHDRNDFFLCQAEINFEIVACMFEQSSISSRQG